MSSLNLASLGCFELDGSCRVFATAISLDQILEDGILPAIAVFLLVQEPLVLVLARLRLLEELGHR